MTPTFHPWRRRVTFLQSDEAPIKPLLEHLSFIKDTVRRDYPFRMGVFEIPHSDFKMIAEAMIAEAMHLKGDEKFKLKIEQSTAFRLCSPSSLKVPLVFLLGSRALPI
ncbi:MAG: hypothetical protein ACRCYY_01015 [Trueperaceae bacterium]